MLDFNMCRWNPYKRPAKNLNLSHRCIGSSTVDISKFHRARQNIVHNVRIFINIIQAYGPTRVPRMQALEHTPQVTNLNLNPFPFKISDSLKTMWREKEECQSVQIEKVIKD